MPITECRASADHAGQRREGMGHEVGGEGEERDRSDTQGGVFTRFAPSGVAGGELPGDRGGRGHLDDRVDAESDQGGGGGEGAGGNRDDGLDDVVRDGRGDQ